jgi:hypothetical protein
VVLDDGRVLVGHSDRSGWNLDRLMGPTRREPIDPEHVEVARIAAEAKAWLKREGGK